MSAQTILHKTVCKLREEVEDKILINAEKYILETDFMLGKGFCRFEQADISRTLDILIKEDCVLNNRIIREIEKVE